MSKTELIEPDESNGVLDELVSLFSGLGFAVVIREPDTAEVMAASSEAESHLLAAEPGSARVASARVGGLRVRVEIARTSGDGPVVLTPRQRAVAKLLAEGRRNTDIANELDISTHTVRRHMESIFRRLRVQNRTAAAAELRKGHIKL